MAEKKEGLMKRRRKTASYVSKMFLVNVTASNIEKGSILLVSYSG